MKYAAAYIRVSDDRQDEYSPDSQLKLIREYAGRNGYCVPDEYVFYDDGISGRSVKKRKAFNDMIAFAKSKEHPFQAILVWKFSRFARNQEESIVYKSMLRRIGVSVISISETIDDSPFAPLIERIIEFMDEYYSTRLSQEVTRGMTEKASRGEAMSAGAFGYDLQNKVFTPNEDAPTVRYIFNAFLSGKGYRKIAMELDAMGVKTYRGNPPDNRFVEYILMNPVYAGKIRWSTDGRASRDRYKGDNSKVMYVDGKHQPIIDQDTFNQVQEKIMEQKRRYGKWQRKEQPVAFMLKGLLRCDICGATLTYIAARNPAVQCHNYARGKCKVSHYLSIRKANAAVIAAIEKSLETLEFNVLPKEQLQNEVVDYSLLIRKEEDKIKRASDAYDAGYDTLEEYGRKKRAFQNKIETLKAEQAKVEKSQSGEIPPQFVQQASFVLDLIKSPETAQSVKNEALRSIVDHITFKKPDNTLEIFYYI